MCEFPHAIVITHDLMQSMYTENRWDESLLAEYIDTRLRMMNRQQSFGHKALEASVKFIMSAGVGEFYRFLSETYEVIAISYYIGVYILALRFECPLETWNAVKTKIGKAFDITIKNMDGAADRVTELLTNVFQKYVERNLELPEDDLHERVKLLSGNFEEVKMTEDAATQLLETMNIEPGSNPVTTLGEKVKEFAKLDPEEMHVLMSTGDEHSLKDIVHAHVRYISEHLDVPTSLTQAQIAIEQSKGLDSDVIDQWDSLVSNALKENLLENSATYIGVMSSIFSSAAELYSMSVVPTIYIKFGKQILYRASGFLHALIDVAQVMWQSHELNPNSLEGEPWKHVCKFLNTDPQNYALRHKVVVESLRSIADSNSIHVPQRVNLSLPVCEGGVYLFDKKSTNLDEVINIAKKDVEKLKWRLRTTSEILR